MWGRLPTCGRLPIRLPIGHPKSTKINHTPPLPDRVSENAAVLFMDIVSYSKQTVDQQVKLISLLQSAVNQSPEFQAAHETDLIKLPTGDGMALVFTRDLVAPVQCALEIAKAIQADDELKVRMGIHTGPITRQVDRKSTRLNSSHLG